MVEALDRNFKNVCELDIIFNVEQVQRVSTLSEYVISIRAAHRTFVLGFGGPASRVVWSCREVVECDGVRLRYLVTY